MFGNGNSKFLYNYQFLQNYCFKKMILKMFGIRTNRAKTNNFTFEREFKCVCSKIFKSVPLILTSEYMP